MNGQEKGIGCLSGEEMGIDKGMVTGEGVERERVEDSCKGVGRNGGEVRGSEGVS